MDHNSIAETERRRFLETVAAVTAGAAVPTSVGSAQSSLDDYHQTLRTELTSEHGLPAGEFVYGTTERAALDAFSLSGGENGTESEIDVSAAGVPITMADRVEIDENPDNAYSYTYQADVPDRSFEEGDALLAVAYLRGVEAAGEDASPETQAGFKWRYTNPDGSTGYSSNMVASSVNVSPGESWDRHFFVIEVGSKPEGSEHQPYLEFWTGFREQVIGFGGIALVDYGGTDVTADRLDQALVSYEYEGRGEDAQWRQDARERIEEIHTTGLEVAVTGPDGEPVEGATVEVAMQAHEFDFGGEFTLSQIGDRWDSDVAETYRERFQENFNKAALTNGLKVSPWNGDWGEAINAETARRAIQWFLDEDVPTRGHALVWEEWDWMNVDSELSDAEVNDLVQERIRNRASEFQGDLVEWDVHNHPIWQSNIRDQIGEEAALDWWATAHDAAPDARMYVNEMNIVAGSSYRDPYDEFITWLLDNDAGVEGIGFMGHFDVTDLVPPTEILSVFDRFAEHGVPLQLTEFDVQMESRDNEAKVSAQADYVRDVLTAAFSHEAVEGVMSWCLWDEDGDPRRYYDADWTLRPHGEEYQRLVFEEWWTDESGQTDGEGTYATSAFEGTYEITASDNDTSETVTTAISEDTGPIEVTLGDSASGDADSGESEDGTDSDSTDSLPGFGVAAGVAGLAGAAGYARFREDADE